MATWTTATTAGNRRCVSFAFALQTSVPLSRPVGTRYHAIRKFNSAAAGKL